MLMNYQERKVHFYLLWIQGTYYFFLGSIVLSFRLATDLYLLDDSPRGVYLSTLTSSMLMGIGITLFLAKKHYKKTMTPGVLGIITAFSFFIHHSIFLYRFDSSPFLWIDWLFQFSFLLGWTWLFYWKW